MTRPRKQVVDYFPHDCNHGKTLFILEQKYGNDGYAFWFKLLELIGSSEQHYLDCDDKPTWEYLLSRASFDDETGWEIMELLANLGAIDPELWQSHIVWSDNFVKRITDVYRNRLSEIPIRPDNLRKKPRKPTQSDAENPADGVRNPQTKLKETKLKESKDNAPSDSGALQFYSCKFFDVSLEYREKLAQEYPALTDPLLLSEFSKMEDWLTDNPKPKRATGKLKNTRLFIKNWLGRMTINPTHGPARAEPKGFQALRDYAARRKPDASE